jgi:hypothetical protein
VRGRNWVATVALALLAALTALGAFGFWQAAGAQPAGGWAGAAAYVGAMQAQVAEHEGMLYRLAVSGQAELNGALDRSESALTEGADWLARQNEGESASAVRKYLSEAAGARRTGRKEIGALLAGPVHGAATGAAQTLAATQDRLQKAERAEAARAGAGSRRMGWLLLTLSGALALAAPLAVLAAPGERSAPPAPATAADQPTEAPEAAILREKAARAQDEAERQARQKASLGAAGGLASEVAAVVRVSRQHARGLEGVAGALSRLSHGYARSAATVLQPPAPTEESSPGGEVGAALEQARRAAEAIGAVLDVAAQAAVPIARGGARAGAAETALEQLDSAVRALAELEQRAAYVDQAVAAIKAIATQTNMLALNAAIEAARAGQHGKGFAVVADSVRSLAGQAQQQAREIGLRVAGMAVGARQGAEALAGQRALVESLQAESAPPAGLEALVTAAYVAASATADLERDLAALAEAGRQAARARESARAPAPGRGPVLPDETVRRLGDQAGLLSLEASETAIAAAEVELEALTLAGQLAVLQGSGA